MINNFSVSPANLPNLIAKLNQLDLSLGYVVSAKVKKQTRTHSQNDWARKYARDFGAHFGYDADFAYDMLMYKFNPIFKADPEGNEIRIGGSFSKLNTAEAALVQDSMLRYGIENGFYWEREYN